MQKTKLMSLTMLFPLMLGLAGCDMEVDNSTNGDNEIVKPDVKPEPEPTPDPDVVPDPDPVPDPEPTPNPNPEPDPLPEPKPEPVPGPSDETAMSCFNLNLFKEGKHEVKLNIERTRIEGASVEKNKESDVSVYTNSILSDEPVLKITRVGGPAGYEYYTDDFYRVNADDGEVSVVRVDRGNLIEGTAKEQLNHTIYSPDKKLSKLNVIKGRDYVRDTRIEDITDGYSEISDENVKTTFVGMKDLEVNGVNYSTCRFKVNTTLKKYINGKTFTVISDEDVYWSKDTGVKLLIDRRFKDSDDVEREVITTTSYKVNGVELLN